MKSVSENLFQRGKLKTFYVRRRIPTALLSYFDGRKEIVRSLKTSDKSKALKLARIHCKRGQIKRNISAWSSII